MKVLDSSAGAVTNFELLDLLRSRGAGTELIRPIFSVSLSEFEVFDYLKLTVACNQTREIFEKLIDECKKFDLTKAEICIIANIRPTSAAELSPIIEEWESRMGSIEGKGLLKELAETIHRILPPPVLCHERRSRTTKLLTAKKRLRLRPNENLCTVCA